MPPSGTLQEMVAAEAAEEAAQTKAGDSAGDSGQSETKQGGAAESTEPETGSTADEGAEESDQEGASEASLLSLLDRMTPYKWSSKYANDQEAARAVASLVELRGRADDDARLGRRVREAYGDRGAEDLLSRQRSTSPQEETVLPRSFEEYELLLESLGPNSSASDEAKRRSAQAYRNFAKRMFDVVSSPERALSGSEAFKALAQRVATLESGVTQATQIGAVRAWVQQHTAEFFDDKGEYTPLGKKTEAVYYDDPVCQTMPEGAARWEAALRFAKGAMPTPRPTKKVPREAEHKPPPAGAAVGPDTVAERFRQMRQQGIPAEKCFEALAAER